MSETRVPQPAGLRHPCEICEQYESTLRLHSLLHPGRPQYVCERCADVENLWENCDDWAPAPTNGGFIWVDPDFVRFVAPHLNGAAIRTYLALVNLCDNRQDRPSVGVHQLADWAQLAPRNVRRALATLDAAGVIVRLQRPGPIGTRYLLVRPHVTSRSRGCPATLIQPDVYTRAAALLPRINRSPVGGSTDPPTGDQLIPGSAADSFSLPSIRSPPSIHRESTSPASQPPSSEAPRNGGRDGARIVREASATAEEIWPDYAPSIVAERVARLYAWAKTARQPVTAKQLAAFMREGAADEALQRQQAAGKIHDRMSVACMKHRWERWLAKANQIHKRRTDQRKAEQLRLAPQAEEESYRRAAEQATAGLRRQGLMK